MDTRLLHEKINRFSELISKGKLNFQIAREFVIDMNTWITNVDGQLSEYEIDIMLQAYEIKQRNDMIQLLCDILLLTGNGGIITTLSFTDMDKIKKAVDFLFKNRDRNNCKDIYKIGSLLEIAERDGIIIETIDQFREYVK